MNTFTYNSVGLSVKDRLTISNLLGLFEGRLNAKWVSVTAAPNKAPQLQLIDVDQPEGLQLWEGRNPVAGCVAVTSNDRWPAEPFISRPIRAYGPNGVIVLFNSIAQSLASPAPEDAPPPQHEPKRFRMTGRLDAPEIPTQATSPVPTNPAPPIRAAAPRAPWSLTVRPTVKRAVAAPPEPPPAEAPPPPVRVAVRWGPPEPVVLPPLTRMPGARIHRLGESSLPESAVEIPLPKPSIYNVTPAVAEATSGQAHLKPAQSKAWAAPRVAEPISLMEMPTAHRPVEIHTPSAPVIGRSRLEAFAYAPPVAEDVPVLRAARPQWKLPEQQSVKPLVDFRTWQDAPAPVEPDPAPQIAEIVTIEHLADAIVIEAEIPVSETQVAVEHLIKEPVAGTLPADSEEASVVAEDANDVVKVVPETADEEEVQALFNDVQHNLETLSRAITDEAYPEELPELDAEADWWGTADLEAENLNDLQAEVSEDLHLLEALKAVKASGQPSILEIAGLPAVCVIPARNIYFTAAPAARIETAIGAMSEVTWRACSTEAEARQLSGTEQSRQASLEQLSWTAALMTPPSDADGIADRAVRLRRWPPITESRGRSKFLRYATILSGAQATPRELADITGDSVEEIVAFVNACAHMNLLETSGSAAVAVALPPTRNGGAGILRDMIEQLSPPKI